jgi:hypothetical protein
VAFAVRHLLTGSFAPIGAALFGFLYAPLVITGEHREDQRADRDNDQVEVVRHDALEARLDKA